MPNIEPALRESNVRTLIGAIESLPKTAAVKELSTSDDYHRGYHDAIRDAVGQIRIMWDAARYAAHAVDLDQAEWDSLATTARTLLDAAVKLGLADQDDVDMRMHAATALDLLKEED